MSNETTLLDITLESMEIAKTVAKLTYNFVHFSPNELKSKQTAYVYFVNLLENAIVNINPSEGILSNELEQAIYELLDGCRTVLYRLAEDLENVKVSKLILRIDCLLTTLNKTTIPKTQTDDFLQRRKPDKDFTESPIILFMTNPKQVSQMRLCLPNLRQVWTIKK